MRTKDILPLTEHRAHLSENFKQVQETGRPLFVTANGRTAAVVLSPDAYDALKALAEKAELAENLSIIRQGREDFKAGRVHDARQSIRQLAEERGIDLPQ